MKHTQQKYKGSKSGTSKRQGDARHSKPKIKDFDENQPVRLNKFLADSGVASRRKADELIKYGFVKVNKKTVKELGTKVTAADFITVRGDPIENTQRLVYILLNKPKDVITTTKDDQGRKTVMDIVRKKVRLYPVGRLDRNTTGALLITNDGELAHRLTHPSFQVVRTYAVGLDKQLDPKHARQIARGVELEDGKTAPCEIFISPEDEKKVEISLVEGKNHEVKRVFEKFEYRVKKLDRKNFAGLTNSGLRRGEYRHLKQSEVNALRKLVGLSRH